MKRFVFFGLPGHGHINPTLSVAQELVRRGDKVAYYSTGDFRHKIESAGVTFRNYPVEWNVDPRMSKNVAVFAKLGMELCEKLLPKLLQEIKNDHPDCIAHDTLSLWGKALASSLHIPAVSFFTSMAMNNAVYEKNWPIYVQTMAQTALKPRALIQAYSTYLHIAKTYGLKPSTINDFLFSTEKLNIVFTSATFQPCAQSFDSSFKFVGPAIMPSKEKVDFSVNQNKKLIYISVGTIFNDNLNFYRMCLDAFANTPYQIVLALGHRFSIADLPPISDNIIVTNHVPQLEILKKADAFITHAGMNSVNESLLYGVPMILIPQIHEQTFNARRVKELGAGIYLKKEKVTKEVLLQSVMKTLQTKSYCENSAKIQKTLIDAGGYKKAAELILQYSNH